MGDLQLRTNNRVFLFANKRSNLHVAGSSVFEFKFVAIGDVAPSNLVAASFNGKPVLTSLNGMYDYGAVLRASLLFYEAQRAGKLPANNRISWRNDSMLMDKGENGEDLTGGYFDAGDYVKFGFPMASFTTLLAWGAIEYEDAYRQAGQLNYVREAVRWSTDYFIKVSATHIVPIFVFILHHRRPM